MAVSTRSSESPQVRLGGTPQTFNGSIQAFESLKVSPSSFLSSDGEGARQESRLPFRNRRLRSRGGLYLKVVLGTLASAAAIAVLIALCAAACLWPAPPQVTKRRLSEGAAPESAAGLAACGETTGSDGDHPQASLQEEELEPPLKKAKEDERSFAAATEAGPQPQPSGSGLGASPHTAAGAAAVTAPEALSPFMSPTSQEGFISAQALSSLSDALPPASSDQAVPGPAFQQEAQVFLSPQQAQLLAIPQQQVQIHLQPQQPPLLLATIHQQQQLAPAFQQQAQPGLHAPQQAQPPPALQQQAAATHPLPLVSLSPLFALATAAGPVVISPISLVPLGPAGLGDPQPQPDQAQLAGSLLTGPPRDLSQEAQPEPFLGARAMSLLSNQELEVIEPLGDWEPPSSDQARGGRPFVEHAFSRLPVVPHADPSAYSSIIDRNRSKSKKASSSVQLRVLRKLRTLLARPTLSPSELQQVAEIAGDLISHLTFEEGGEVPKCPSYAVEKLGYRFLLLDLTVSALQVLGVPRSGTWWNDVISQIGDDYTVPFRKWFDELARFNFNLMTRLTTAIRILKDGDRPDRNLVVHLKRCLFCCKQSPIRFLRPGYDPWREDDKKFYQQFKDSPGQGDSAKPGPSHQSGS
ncbi:hypothetical protein ACSSS7_000390 [Eimeria intestinalis]